MASTKTTALSGWHFLPLLVLISVLTASPASAQARWEDYQGTNDILGSSNQDKPGPSYNNNSGSLATNIGALRTLSADPANATRTGTTTVLDYGPNAFAFCNTTNTSANTSYDAAGTGAACQADSQGRVTYALIKFPVAGNYTFEVSHDDEVDLDLSSDYTNTTYRTAAYNLPVGTASSFTNQTTYETLGTVNAPSANSCILLRLYWNNAGGLHFMRMRWDTPSATNQAIPASQIFDPGNPASVSGCTAAVTGTGTSLTVNKIVGGTGRASAADQFAITAAVNSSGALVGSATTGGSGTGQQASTGAILINNGVVYRITDAMAAGSTSTIASYVPSIACTRAGVAYTPGGTAPNWTVATSALNQQIVCNVTNTRGSATLQLRKSWSGAVTGDAVSLPATTGFSANTAPFAAAANTPTEIDSGTAVSILVGESGTLGAETFTTGAPSAYASVLSCSNGTLSGTNGQAANTLSVGSVAAGTAIQCTYTNTWRPPLTFSKSSALFSGSSPAFMIPGNDILYSLNVSNTTSNPVTGDSIFVVDALPGSLTFFNGDANGPAVAGTDVVIFTDSGSGLTFNPATDLRYATSVPASFAACTYAPVAGYDPLVTHICLNPKGTMLAKTGTPTPSFSFTFRAQIK